MGARLAAIIFMVAFPAMAGEMTAQQRRAPPPQSQAAKEARLDEIDAKLRALAQKLAEPDRRLVTTVGK